MEKSEKEFVRQISNDSFEYEHISFYAFIVGIFILFFTLVKYLKKRISSYSNQRNKLIELAEEYERKRNGRNDLKVRVIFKVKVSLLLENRISRIKIC